MTGVTPTGVLVMAHGTPASLDDLPAFYTEIRRGRPPSPAQLAELEQRYRAIGGTSPLNATTRAQAEGIAAELERRRPGGYVVRHGARFADPRIEAAVDALVDAGVTRVIGLVLAPHSSRASVAEYERRAGAAVAAAGARSGRDVELHVVDHWYDAPGFAELVARRLRDAVEERGRPEHTLVVFTAHSVPAGLIAAGDTYDHQVAESAAQVAAAAGVAHAAVAWQSAGRTDDEWLGPDVRQVIDEVDASTEAVVVCPVGFVADHLEVLYDVDVEARAVAERRGVAFGRTASFNADADFCALLADVVLGAAEGEHA
jgi:ferrochelatase